MPLGIRPTMGTGAFRDQVNTRVMEQFIDKAEYLLTIDYDTFFTKEDVEHLFALAMTFQCDAITGLQTKREDGRPMLSLKGTLDNPPEGGSTSVPTSWFSEPVQEVDSAHFGLTVISTAALKRNRKPWFWSTPGPDGSWNEGRVDPDIYWWKNLRGERQPGFCVAACRARPRRVCRDVARQGSRQAGFPVDNGIHQRRKASRNCMERASTVKIKFVRAWRAYRKGQSVDIPHGLASQLVAQRAAVRDTQPELIETAALEPVVETADATPKRRAKRAIHKPDPPDSASR
jgi:hypothetical protein